MNKSIVHKCLTFIDIIFLPLLILTAPILKLYARFNGKRLPRSRKLLQFIGVYPIRDHYYQPLFKHNNLKKSFREKRNLPGINLNESAQLELLSKLNFSNELIDLSLNKTNKYNYEFNINHGPFRSGDADFIYQIIRYYKPKNIIEIGSGSSTLIASIAREKNDKSRDTKTSHICIEPYQGEFLAEINGIDVVRSLVEECDKETFKRLGENDLLFIDSSHIIRPQGDVLFEYLELLPSLNKGVIVHIHDIFTPRDYLDEWISDQVLFWNEQYLVEALISNSNRYEVIASLNHLKHNHFDKLKRVCPYLSIEREPGSLYLRII
tara:strand:+ start:2907 stop:3872 length:966 start_codon:yes stop_codon:yes gene_type:complete